MKLARSNAILSLPIDPGLSLAGREGYVVTFYNGGITLQDDAVDGAPVGVLLEGGTHPERASVALAAGGLAGTVRVKLAQPVTAPGTTLKLVSTAQGCAFGPATSSGAQIIMAVAFETGAAGELIEAALFKPRLIYPDVGASIAPDLA